MDKLILLMSKCKCGVYVSINEHRNNYESVEELLERRDDNEIESEVKQKMIESDTVVQVQFYPDTPIGSYDVYHHNLDEALDQALSCFSQK